MASPSRDALFGRRWKLNAEASTFSTDAFSPNEETRLYEEVDNGYKLTVRGVNRDREYSWEYTARYDGEHHPVTGREDVDSIVAHRIDENNTVGYFYLQDRTIGFYARIVSGDNLVVQAGGISADGSPYYDVIHYRE